MSTNQQTADKMTLGEVLAVLNDPQAAARLRNALGASERRDVAAGHALGAQIAEAMSRANVKYRSSFREHHASSFHTGYGRHASSSSALEASMDRLLAAHAGPMERRHGPRITAEHAPAVAQSSLSASMDKLVAAIPMSLPRVA